MNISDEVVSIEEAKAALRCMRLCDFDEVEALESIDSLVGRIRKITTAKLLEQIIETRLSKTQQSFIREYWFNEKNTAQIAREYGVSQANVYRTLTRATETIRELLTPLVMYYNDLNDVTVVPLYVEDAFRVSAAGKLKKTDLASQLKALRVSNSVTAEAAAEAMCITEKMLNEIESGKRTPTVENLERYSKFFGISIDVNFVNGKGRFEWKEA